MARYLILLLLGQFALAGCQHVAESQNLSLEFARAAFTKMANGDQSVSSEIDWDHFKVGSIDIGAKYRKPYTESEKSRFRGEVVSNYASTFKQDGATMEMVSDWRVDKEDETTTMVSCKGQTSARIVLTVTKSGDKMLLQNIQVQN